jgi:hypothetical protein
MSEPLIAFEDAEAVAVQHLLTVLTDVHVSTDVPSTRPSQFVTVERAGGVRRNLISDSAVLIIQAWADNKPDAYDLVKLVRAHVHAMPGAFVDGVWVYRVDEIAGPGYVPDPDTNTPRYQFTVQLHLRGTQL